MLKKIDVLIISDQKENPLFNDCDGIAFHKYTALEYSEKIEEDEEKYGLMIIDGECPARLIAELDHKMDSYRWYYTEKYSQDFYSFDEKNLVNGIFYRKMACLIEEEMSHFIEMIPTRFHLENSVSKLWVKSARVVNEFRQNLVFHESDKLEVTAKFGNTFTQVVYFTHYLYLDRGIVYDIWPEFSKSGNVEIEYRLAVCIEGADDQIRDIQIFSENDLRQVCQTKKYDAVMHGDLSVFARGEGTITIGNFHFNASRDGYGHSLLGAGRIIDNNRELMYYYLNPMDGKPPLNVYFAGFHTAMQFEGTGMMKRLGSPYLLFSDPRLDGGAFYLGSEEFESKIAQVIKDSAAFLGFTNKQIILSGLSMGTFGAMYYASDINPKAVIIGKPLANLGDVAANERLNRPGGFPTSLDLIKKEFSSLDERAVRSFNKVAWNKLDDNDFSDIIFAVAYMKHDDYDKNAYDGLMDTLEDSDVKIYGKGIRGRHNDDTGGVVDWFISQYKKIMREQFNR